MFGYSSFQRQDTRRQLEKQKEKGVQDNIQIPEDAVDLGRAPRYASQQPDFPRKAAVNDCHEMAKSSINYSEVRVARIKRIRSGK